MSNNTSKDKKLFVCTRPYQYLVARLIKEGCKFDNCDLMVLNHFHGSRQFCDMVKQTGVWNRVIYYDDSPLNQYKSKLNPLEKYFFYRTWKKFIPDVLPDVANYSEVFLAHDGVAAEYAIMRKFQSEGKPVIIYEEGFGNYIDNSTHLKFSKKLMKKFSPILGLPGGYIGGLKWIESIWLQHPELITVDVKNPLRHKTKQLPLSFRDFLQMPKIFEELYTIYPELNGIDELMKGEDSVAVLLTDLWLDEIPNRDEFMNQTMVQIKDSTGRSDIPVFVKQHPGEILHLEEKYSWKLLSQNLPIELLYFCMLRNKLKKISLFSFGSTAVLNLYDLCKDDGNLDVYIIGSVNIAEEYKIIASRFRELAIRCHIQYHFV